MLSPVSVVFPSQVFWWQKRPEERKDKRIWHLRSPVPERNTGQSSHLKIGTQYVNVRRLK